MKSIIGRTPIEKLNLLFSSYDLDGMYTRVTAVTDSSTLSHLVYPLFLCPFA